MLREIRLHSFLKHENIIRLYTSFEDSAKIYLLQEYATHDNLFYFIGKLNRKNNALTEDEAFYYFIQAVQSIYFLHSNGMIHRDLKPENLLVTADNTLKLCDFGTCAQSQKLQERSTYCGTYAYMAPEMIMQKKHGSFVDNWALGCLLYELCHGISPFEGEAQDNNALSVLKRIKET